MCFRTQNKAVIVCQYVCVCVAGQFRNVVVIILRINKIEENCMLAIAFRSVCVCKCEKMWVCVRVSVAENK